MSPAEPGRIGSARGASVRTLRGRRDGFEPQLRGGDRGHQRRSERSAMAPACRPSQNGRT